MHRRGVLLVLLIFAAGLLEHPARPTDHGEVPVGPGDTRRHSPSVAVDSDDPNKVVISTYDADRLSIRLFVSRDGGRKFAETRAPKALGWRRYQPEVMLVGGRLYLAYSAYDDDEGAIAIVRSDDLGTTWDRPRFVVRSIMETKVACTYPSSPSLAIDPSRPSVVFVSWESWDYLGGCNEEVVRTWVGRSDDGGTRFGGPVEVPLPGRKSGDYVYYTQLVALGKGKLALTAEVDRMSSARTCPSGNPQDVVVSVSDDAGRSFRSRILAEACSPAHTWTSTPAAFVSMSPTGGTYWHGARTALVANRRTGTLIAAWISGNAAGVSRLSTAHSPDGGRTWQDAGVPAEPAANQQHFPSLAVAPDGSVVALYLAQVPGGIVEPRMSVSKSLGTWTAPVTLASRAGVAQESPVRGTSVALSSYYGEATSLAIGGGGTAHPAWVDLRNSRIGPAASPYQILTRRIGITQ